MAEFVFLLWLAEWIEDHTTFEFEWDLGNQTINLVKHGITTTEAESVFTEVESIRVLGEQVSPETIESRFGILGVTSDMKHVFVCFTIRRNLIRVIHIRKMNKNERSLYAELCKE